MKNPRSHLIKYLKVCELIVGILIILFVLIYGALPFLLESQLKRIIEKSGLGQFSGSARRVSLTGFDLNSIILGNPNKPYASVSSVAADYSIWALLRGQKSESLVLNGVEINCSYDGTNIVFPGLDISKMTKSSQSLEETGNAIISLIEMKNSVLNMNYRGKHLNIPFKLKYLPGKKWSDGHAKLELSVREQILNANLTFNEKSATGTIFISDLDPEVFYDFFPEDNRFSGLHLSDISFDFAITNKGVKGTAKANIQTPLLVNPNSKASISIPLSFKYCADFSGKWEGGCESHFDSIMLKSEKITSVVNNPILFVGFSGLKKSGSAKLDLKSDLVSVLFPSGSGSLKDTSLCVNTQFNEKGISGEVSFKASSIESSAFQAVIKSPAISLPFNLPTTSEPVKKGCLSISSISVKNINIGTVSGQLQQIGSSIAFSATAPSVILPNMAANFNGTCGMNKDKDFEADVFFNVPKYKVTTPINISKWIPSASGITYQGEYEVKEGTFKLSPSNIESKLKLNISNSTLEIKSKEGNICASGISLGLELKDILNLRSAPSQSLKISKFSFGPINIEDVIIFLHIENLKAILIESIRAKWCDGTISVQAIRIDPSVKNYAPVISCDRVSFPKILEQLSLGKAEGDGTLNGNIPITFSDGKIGFDNGFLYSTPGSSGKIKIEGGTIESITEDMAKNNPVLAEVSLAEMALRDFEYKWAKLHLNTEGENIIAKIQISGKPAKPLPFAYKKEYGYFVLDANSPGSIFKGLTLDINIKLPFNKFMLYNRQIQNIMSK